MKKIFYIALALSSSFLMQSCEPMEDIYAEIDAKTTDPTGIKDLELKLTSVEYKLIEKVPGAGNTVKNNAFISEDTAKVLIPEILAKKYLYLGEKAAISVTYDLGNVNTKLNPAVVGTATNEIYASVTGGTRFQNFNSEAQIISGAKLLNPNPVQGDRVKITYKWASNTGVDSTSNVVYLNDTWFAAYTLTAADYKSMEQSYSNFTTVAAANSYFPTFLKNKYPYKTTEGAILTIVWDLYASSVTTTSVTILKYTNGVWVVNNGTNTATLKFSKTKGVWVADNTIKYTLTTDDHKTGVAPFVTDAAAKSSIASYGNFDLKLFTSQQDILKYLGQFLKAKFPTAAVGQKYLVTYKTYNPNANATAWLILGEGGEYTEVAE